MSHLDVEDGLEGYVDALKDTGEWWEMSEKEQKQSLKNAAVYFDKIFHGILESQITALNILRPGWKDGPEPVQKVTQKYIDKIDSAKSMSYIKVLVEAIDKEFATGNVDIPAEDWVVLSKCISEAKQRIER